jgi:exosortase/archaeosortase family protein
MGKKRSSKKIDYVKKDRYLWGLFIRYLILVVFCMLGVKIIYAIFTTLTIYPVYFILKQFFSVSLIGSFLFVNNLPIEIIGPCVAGSAYLLLLILNLSTPNIAIARRIGMFFFSFSFLLLINILRIVLLSFLFISGNSFFNIAHLLFWYIGSVIFVVGIWFLTVKIFRGKEIPFYSDIKYLFNGSKLKH